MCSSLSPSYGSLCVPGVQPAHVRRLVGTACRQVGMRQFHAGTEVRGKSELLRSLHEVFASDGLYGGLECSADSYSERVFNTLRSVSMQVATVESCTAGMVGASLTEIPGSSALVWGGFIVYSDEAKIRLGVSPAVLEQYGAVSEESVRGLVDAALAASSADMAVSVSGIAGPDGGTPDKPVGTVWVAAGARKGGTRVRHCAFEGTREEVRWLSVGACHGVLLRKMSELTTGY